MTDMGVAAGSVVRALCLVLALAGAAEAQTVTPEPRPDALDTVPWVQTERDAGLGLCGNPTIIGERRDPLVNRAGGCFILNPIELNAIEGVQLSDPVLVDCPTARALADWVRDGVKPVFGERGGGLAVLEVAGSYACRPVNHQMGGRLSEHGRGRAVDVSGFWLADGTLISVLRGWRDKTNGPDLRRIHAVACGPFATVLGPNADRHHQDHFHLDTSLGRSGAPYCR